MWGGCCDFSFSQGEGSKKIIMLKSFFKKWNKMFSPLPHSSIFCTVTNNDSKRKVFKCFLLFSQSPCLLEERNPSLLPRLTGRRLRTRCLRWAWCLTRYSIHTCNRWANLYRHIIQSLFTQCEAAGFTLTLYLLGRCLLSWPASSYSSVSGRFDSYNWRVKSLWLSKHTSLTFLVCHTPSFLLLSSGVALDFLTATLIFIFLLPTIQMCVFDQENFQGRCMEITGECMNVCDMGMDRVRSLRVDCGP